MYVCMDMQTFALPNLSPRDKFKLTAHEGSKLRRVGFINFRSRSGMFSARHSFSAFNFTCDFSSTNDFHYYVLLMSDATMTPFRVILVPVWNFVN